MCTEFVGTDLADVLAFQSQARHKRDGGRDLPAGKNFMTQDFRFCVEMREFRDHADPIHDILSEPDYVKLFVSGKSEVKTLARILQLFDPHKRPNCSRETARPED